MQSSTNGAEERPAISPFHRIVPLLREPILHFTVMGLALFIAVSFVEQHSTRHRIAIGAGEVERIKIAYTQQFGGMPTPEQMDSLIDRYIQEEIFFREGLALGLDRDDEIVRRRVAQKFEFLQQDLVLPEEPDVAALRAYFDQNAARYAEPARVSFSQIYFSADRSGDAEARARAITVSARLDAVAPSPALGDPFPGQSEVTALSAEELSRLFGQSPIVGAAFGAPVGQWSGPYRSGYGWHLILVTARTPAQRSTFEAVQDRVVADYSGERGRALNESAYAELRRTYHISIEGRAP